MQEAQPAKVTKPSEIQTATIILAHYGLSSTNCTGAETWSSILLRGHAYDSQWLYEQRRRAQ